MLLLMSNSGKKKYRWRIKLGIEYSSSGVPSARIQRSRVWLDDLHPRQRAQLLTKTHLILIMHMQAWNFMPVLVYVKPVLHSFEVRSDSNIHWKLFQYWRLYIFGTYHVSVILFVFAFKLYKLRKLTLMLWIIITQIFICPKTKLSDNFLLHQTIFLLLDYLIKKYMVKQMWTLDITLMYDCKTYINT